MKINFTIFQIPGIDPRKFLKMTKFSPKFIKYTLSGKKIGKKFSRV